jgi:ubiquinone/menaquinone biosynthesis C-methylase UbiE
MKSRIKDLSGWGFPPDSTEYRTNGAGMRENEVMKSILSRIEQWMPDRFKAKKLNLELCSKVGLWDDYFKAAESAIDEQWDQIIWPLIREFDFTTVLELAPGAGRNTIKLSRLATLIHAVDLNEYALAQCKARLDAMSLPCRIEFHKNNGTDLHAIADHSITAIYCFDAAVHFDRAVLRDYIAEFSRVLKPGGKGFVHHSALGDRADIDISNNPHSRSNMSRHLFAKYCSRYGLTVLSQTEIPWGEIVDCATIFQLPM